MRPSCSRKPLSFGTVLLALAAAWLAASGTAAQQTPPAASSAPQAPPGLVRVTTRVVVVDVIVTDKEGRPITGLTRDDFTLLENSEPQTIASFSIETPEVRRLGQPAPPPLPPNVYTNRPEYRIPPGPLTILLLDALNTPVTDQSFARQKMLDYLNTQLLPEQRTAILALTTDLLVLQDFTTNPAQLRAALNKQLPKTSTTLTREDRGPELSSLALGEVERMRPLPEPTLASLERFQTEQLATAVDARVLTTLAALRAIARTVAGYPGRKNLVWVSAAFPFAVVPVESETYDLLRFYTADLERTATALADAQIAIYPVDARGLMGSLGRDLPAASESGRIHDRLPHPEESAAVAERQADALLFSHQSMRHLAEATGGRAFTNRNDIEAAISRVIEDGSTYYTLGYYPTNTDWDGTFRRIRVRVSRSDVVVRHRRGYYAIDPLESAREPGENVFSGLHDPKDRSEGLRAALSSPLPATSVTFRAGVPPPAPGSPARVECRFLVDARTILFTEREGARESNLDFLVVAFDASGKGVASNYQTVETHVLPQNIPWVEENGLPFTLPLELAPGRYQLRLLVRDNRTGLIGTADASLIIEKPGE